MHEKFDVSKTSSTEENSQDSVSTPSEKTTISSKFTFFSSQAGATIHGDHAHLMLDHGDHIHFLTMYTDGELEDQQMDKLFFLMAFAASNDYAFELVDDLSDSSSDENDTASTHSTDTQIASDTDSDSEESQSEEFSESSSAHTAEESQEESEESYGLHSLGL